MRGPRAVREDWEALNLQIWLAQTARYLAPENPALAHAMLGAETPQALAARLSTSRLADPIYRAHLWEGGADAVAASDDTMIVFVRGWDAQARTALARYQDEVEGPIARAHERIARVRFRAFGDATYPDATFSPRLSYGRVEGWRDGARSIWPEVIIA